MFYLLSVVVKIVNNSATKIIIGDFNSHRIEWRYKNRNEDGGQVE